LPLAKVHSELAAAMGPEAFHAAACRRAEPVLQHRCHTWRFSRPRALGERSSRRPSAGQGPGRALGERSASASPLSECCESCLNAMSSRRELVQGPGSKKSSWEVSTLRALKKQRVFAVTRKTCRPPPGISFGGRMDMAIEKAWRVSSTLWQRWCSLSSRLLPRP
jgi:hypothetical protein